MAFRADSHKLVGQLNVDGSQFIAHVILKSCHSDVERGGGISSSLVIPTPNAAEESPQVLSFRRRTRRRNLVRIAAQARSVIETCRCA